jgi:hypothetical protein
VKESEYIAESKKIFELLSENLPEQVDNLDYGEPSLIPSKVMVFRETLFHRVVDIADSAIFLAEKRQIVPSAILGRAIMETSAALCTLSVKCSRFVEGKISLEQFDEYLMKSMFGSKYHKSKYSTYNIQNAIDEISKKYDGFRELYDRTCEIVHPSWVGVQGAYSKLNTETHILSLGKKESCLSSKDAWLPIILGLELFSIIYNEEYGPLKDVLVKLNNVTFA